MCSTVIVSSLWARKHANPLQKGQSWYCLVCGAGYKTKFGVLVEFIHRDGRHYFVRASFPSPQWQDIKWLSVQRARCQEEGQNMVDPGALTQQLLEVHPLTGEI